MKHRVFHAVSALCLLALSAQAQTKPAPKSIRLAFVGDIMLDGLPGESVARGEDPFVGAAATFAKHDLVFGNLECSVASVGEPMSKPYTFRAAPQVVPVLSKHFSALSLANNHSGDYGKAALLETMEQLAASKLPFFGAGRNLLEAHTPRMLEHNGFKVALLGYDEFLPRRFEAGPTTPGVAWSEDEQVIYDIRQARAQGANLVIPFMHWGWEYESAPCERQQTLARLMIDAGADAVIGAHPHVTQTVEIYRGKLIVYSLGNFVFDGFESEDTTTGWLAGLEFDQRGLVQWHTEVFRLNRYGAPQPLVDALSPCGTATQIGSCRAGQR